VERIACAGKGIELHLVVSKVLKCSIFLILLLLNCKLLFYIHFCVRMCVCVYLPACVSVSLCVCDDFVKYQFQFIACQTLRAERKIHRYTQMSKMLTYSVHAYYNDE
jgi:hypothetical protein